MFPLISQPNLQILVNVITYHVIILRKLRLSFPFPFHSSKWTNYRLLKRKNYDWFTVSYCMSWEVQFPWPLLWELYCSAFAFDLQKKLFMKVKLPLFKHYLFYQSILNSCPFFNTRFTLVCNYSHHHKWNVCLFYSL